VIYVIQNGGTFTLIDNHDSASSTFDNCGCSRNGYGGAIYIYSDGGYFTLKGTKLSFSNCISKNGSRIFINADNLETAIKERIILDFNYDITDNTYFVGISNNNIYSQTSLYYYDCYLQNKKTQNQLEPCTIIPTCSLECPTSTIKGIKRNNNF
jgi:hypothetical protein